MGSYRWIPWSFAGALGVVVMVNGALAYLAVSSSTGLVTEHPFESGNGYNRVLAAAAAQDALGWHGTLAFAAAGAETGEIAVELVDRAGQKLTGLAVTALVTRPVEPLPDTSLTLIEAGDGRYRGPVALARPGQWDVHVVARRGGDVFQFAQRIVVK
ncbi:MAG TPA: FixH family protein [Stellaceae bacterium]|nr:FixH family protein [Stellaceae bacterium]